MDMSNVELESNWSWARKHIHGQTKIVNLYYRKDLIDSIKKKLSSIVDEDGSILKKFEQGPFGHLLGWKCGLTNGQALNALIGRQILSPSLPKHELWFRMNETNVRFSCHEFALVTGLSFGGTKFNPADPQHSSSDIGVFQRFCGGNHMSLDALWRLFRGTSRPIKATNDDYLKVANVLFLYLFALGNDLRRKVDNFAWVLVDNLSEWAEFPWGAYCFKAFLYYFNAMKTFGQKYHLFGGAWSLQIWAMEAIPELASHIGKIVDQDILPRCLKWTFKKSRQLDFHILLKQVTLCQVNLEASIVEQARDYFTSCEDLSWLTVGYLKPVNPMNLDADVDVPDVEEREGNRKAVPEKTVKIGDLESRTRSKRRKTSVKVMVDEDKEEDDGDPIEYVPARRPKRSLVKKSTDSYPSSKNNEFLIREDRIVEKVCERVVPKMISYLGDHLVPDMISKMQSLVAQHKFELELKRQPIPTCKCHPHSHDADGGTVHDERVSAGMDSIVDACPDESNHVSRQAPPLSVPPPAAAARFENMMSTDLPVQYKHNAQSCSYNFVENHQLRFQPSLSVDVVEEVITSPAKDADLIYYSSAQTTSQLIQDEPCFTNDGTVSMRPTCASGEIDNNPGDSYPPLSVVAGSDEAHVDKLVGAMSEETEMVDVVKGFELEAGSNKFSLSESFVGVSDESGPHKSSKSISIDIHGRDPVESPYRANNVDSLYPSSPFGDGVPEADIEKLVKYISEDVGIPDVVDGQLLDDMVGELDELHSEDGRMSNPIKAASCKVGGAILDGGGLRRSSRLASHPLPVDIDCSASHNSCNHPTEVISESGCQPQIANNPSDVPGERRIDYTHGTIGGILGCEPLGAQLSVKKKLNLKQTAPFSRLSIAIVDNQRLSREYSFSLTKEFLNWYDNGRDCTNPKSKPVELLWDIFPKQKLTPSWFRAIYCPRQSISGDHCDVLLNLLSHFRSQNLPEYIFLQDWTFLESYATSLLMKGTLAPEGTKYIMEHVMGKMPKQAPKPWNKIRKVYGVALIGGDHWVLYYASLTERSIIVFDTLGSAAKREKIIQNAFLHMAENLSHLGEAVDVNNASGSNRWDVKCVDHTPVQINIHDCGVLAIKLMECLTTGRSFGEVDPHLCTTYRAAYCYELFKLGTFPNTN